MKRVPESPAKGTEEKDGKSLINDPEQVFKDSRPETVLPIRTKSFEELYGNERDLALIGPVKCIICGSEDVEFVGTDSSFVLTDSGLCTARPTMALIYGCNSCKNGMKYYIDRQENKLMETVAVFDKVCLENGWF